MKLKKLVFSLLSVVTVIILSSCDFDFLKKNPDTSLNPSASTPTTSDSQSDKILPSLPTIIQTPTITSHEHTFHAELVEPTCTGSGYTRFTCTSCGFSYTSVYLPKLDHKFTDYVTNVEPTEDNVGNKTRYCTTCGLVENVTLEKLEHHHDNYYVYDEPVPMTCETDGYTIRRCSKCGYEEKIDIIPALGHTIVEEYSCDYDVSATLTYKFYKIKVDKTYYYIPCGFFTSENPFENFTSKSRLSNYISDYWFPYIKSSNVNDDVISTDATPDEKSFDAKTEVDSVEEVYLTGDGDSYTNIKFKNALKDDDGFVTALSIYIGIFKLNYHVNDVDFDEEILKEKIFIIENNGKEINIIQKGNLEKNYICNKKNEIHKKYCETCNKNFLGE